MAASLRNFIGEICIFADNEYNTYAKEKLEGRSVRITSDYFPETQKLIQSYPNRLWICGWIESYLGEVGTFSLDPKTNLSDNFVYNQIERPIRSLISDIEAEHERTEDLRKIKIRLDSDPRRDWLYGWLEFSLLLQPGAIIFMDRQEELNKFQQYMNDLVITVKKKLDSNKDLKLNFGSFSNSEWIIGWISSSLGIKLTNDLSTLIFEYNRKCDIDSDPIQCLQQAIIKNDTETVRKIFGMNLESYKYLEPANKLIERAIIFDDSDIVAYLIPHILISNRRYSYFVDLAITYGKVETLQILFEADQFKHEKEWYISSKYRELEDLFIKAAGKDYIDVVKYLVNTFDFSNEILEDR